MIRNLLHSLFLIFYPGIIVSFFSGCSTDLSQNNQGEESVIKFKAIVAENVLTRTYQDEGKIESGLYYLTYSNPIGNPQYNLATVNFYDGTGFVTTAENKELTWDMVGYDPMVSDRDNSTFYMDNVPHLINDGTTLVDLSSSIQYHAGKFDYEEGYNDLLWGSTKIMRNAQTVPINLHHSMSMVRIEITVDNSKENVIPISLDKATVEFTSIIKKPLIYDRLTGILDLGDSPIYENLTFKLENEDWEKTEFVNNNDKIIRYVTSDFVLPPQDLGAGELRPKLKIYIPQDDGSLRTFSGSLPRAMIVENAQGGRVSMNFSFMREHILTLKVTMDPDLMKLEFLPVTVVDWVDKGTYLATGAQAAIFDEENFMSVIGYYASKDWTHLERYGYIKENTWWFNLYGDLTLAESDIKGKMITDSENPYEFKFNGQIITVKLENGREVILSEDNNGTDKLKNLLNGESIE